MTKHHITWRSKNGKTGPMTVTRTTTDTCPTSCPLLGKGCYDQAGNGAIHRRRHDANEYKSYLPEEFYGQIRKFTTVWRLNEGGDLPGIGDKIDAKQLARLIEATDQAGNGFIGYTHKPVSGVTTKGNSRDRVRNKLALEVIQQHPRLTINLSCDSLEEADRAMALGYNAVVMVPHDTEERSLKTPGGRTLTVCPAQTVGMQCIDCKLCLHKNRKTGVAFKSHGPSKKRISERLNIINQGANATC